MGNNNVVLAGRHLLAVLLLCVLAGLPVSPAQGSDSANGTETADTDNTANDAREPPDERFDSTPPKELPSKPEGRLGFSHYVHSKVGGNIETILIEGPGDRRVRCQKEDLPCSYLELKALHASGDDIPEELEMSRGELGALVAQLDTLSSHLSYVGKKNIDEICADGYQASTRQVANMGIHLTKAEYVYDGIFDLKKPEVLLYASQGGVWEWGQCIDGKWTGDRDVQLVGAAFLLPFDKFGKQHPDAFAGPFDNWHVHYFGCLFSENGRSAMTQEECEGVGGRFESPSPWMIHAYVVPEYDNQAGVFSMWNPTIWPIATTEAGGTNGTAASDETAQKEQKEQEEGRISPIIDFEFEKEISVSVGEALTFKNKDLFVHTVASGSPENPPREGDKRFVSKALNPDDTFTVRFEEPGVYEFYCGKHPFMRGKVVVTEEAQGD